MGSILYWKPVTEYKGSLDDPVKFALRKRYGDQYLKEIYVGQEIIPFLEGLAYGGTEGAQELINLIKEHGELVLNEGY